MVEWRRLCSRPIAAGLLAVGALFAAILLAPASLQESLHEQTLDRTLVIAAMLRPAPDAALPVAVVDIDAPTLEKVGPWPWPREQLARLVEIAGEAGATAIAIDILLEGPDTKSAAALARRLGGEINRPDIVTLAETLPDGDKRLTQALARFPVALGFALDPVRAGQAPAIPMMTRGSPSLAGIWRSKGALGPPELLAENASGMGTLALPGDADGVVRRVPLLVGVGSQVHPGLALEAIRLAQDASAYQIDAEPPAIAVGNFRGPLPGDGFLRLVPDSGIRAPVVVSASEVLGNVSLEKLRGAIVFIGSSAPELGGLRPTHDDPLTPSVFIQTAAAAQFLAGVIPRPVAHADVFEPLMAAAASVLAILAAAFMRPVTGAIVATLAAVACWVIAVAAAGVDRLIDPLPPSAFAVVAFVATAIVAFAEANRREARIRQRFEQHLAPQVVNLIASDPSLLKLRGQRREITALFTDVAGFTAMTHCAEPEALVTLLDDYFEGVVRIVVAHGGMIDKLVGDAVHAFFNAPLDLSDHPTRSVRCALEIRSWTEAYRQRALPASFGFGQTRIGIETGDAIVGDIGISSKLDYTAHGDAVNSAARFEVANKALGTSICVGSGTAERCDPRMLRPIGEIVLQGFVAAVAAFEPWPEDATESWRARYLEAVQLVACDAGAAIHQFEELAAERPHDPIPPMLARRILS